MATPQIDAVYELSPAQQGMLFETVARPGSGVHVEQAVIRIAGSVDTDLLSRAWAHVCGEHDALRATFVWRDQPTPLQAIVRGAAPAMTFEDWRSDPAAAQQQRLAGYLERDRRAGFAMSRAPLMRIALFRLRDDDYQMVWTHHHILIDGWCVPILIREVLTTYDALVAGRPPAMNRPVPYRSFIEWLSRQDRGAAEAFWRTRLRGIVDATPPGVEHGVSAPAVPSTGDISATVSAATAEALRSFARRQRVTPAVLMQAAWALLLSRYSSHPRVLFGATTSGRPADLPDIERMIGLFITSVPIAIDVDGSLTMAAWLERLQRAALEQQPFEHCGMGQILQWSDAPAGRALVASLLVVENYPFGTDDLRLGTLRVDMARSRAVGAQTNYPVTLLVEPGTPFKVQLVYDRSRLEDADAGVMLDDVLSVLEAIAEQPTATVGAIAATLGRRPLPRLRRVALASQTAAEPPVTSMEAAVCTVWAELLGRSPIDRHLQVFEAGGHSLLAARAAARLSEILERNVTLRSIFEHRTPALLAAHLDDKAASAPALAAIPRLPRGGELPLSFAQERLWFVDRLAGGTAAYNAQGAIRLKGNVNLDALSWSLAQLAQRHEILRSTFPERDGRPHVEILPALNVPIRPIDLGSHADPDAALRALAAEDLLTPFDLSTGPLMRARLARMAPHNSVLLLTVHHIVTDGSSNAILFRELAAFYEARVSGMPPKVDQLAVSYVDFAAWQRDLAAAESARASIDHCVEALTGAPPLLRLPIDRPRPPVQTSHGATLGITLGSEVTTGLARVAKDHQATMFMALLAAVNAWLARLTGENDFVVGVPVSGRPRLELQALIGLFINTAAVRARIDAATTFDTLVTGARASMLDAFAHQDVPFEHVVERLSPVRDVSHNPVFQVFFNMLSYDHAPLRLAGVTAEEYPLADQVNRFDLTIYAREHDGVVQIDFLYNPDLFDAASVSRQLAQFERLCAALVSEPGVPIAELSMATESDRMTLPDPTATLERRGPASVVTLIADQVAAQPSATAIVESGERWSYGEVDAWSNRIANALAGAGIDRTHVVAVHARRSAMLPIVLLGIAKAGAAFAIVDPGDPPARAAACLDLARPSGWIDIGDPPADALARYRDACDLRTHLALPASLAALSVCAIAGVPNQAPATEPDPDAIAYVAFTSGTTGQPRAIAGTWRPVAHFIDWSIRTFGVGREDRITMLSGLAHDPLLRDMFLPLCAGGTLCVPPFDVIDGAARMASWMRQSAATICHLTPSMLDVMRAANTTEVVPSLRLVCFGGEPLFARHVLDARVLAPSATVVNYYGTTETPQAVSFAAIAPSDAAADAAAPIPIGRGIDDVNLLVVTAGGQLAAIGEVGEIVIRTPFLSLGYLGDERSSRFAANPFTADAGDRVYRTGDLGRYLSDGRVLHLGRKDRQLKLRGYRIEPGEIEAAFTALDGIQAAAAVHRAADDTLVVAVVAEPGAAIDVADIRRRVTDRLPPRCMPSAIVALGELPLTANGKVHGERILQEAAASSVSDDAGEPVDDTERSIAAIWSAVIGSAPPSMLADFFACGGHSLKAVQMVSRIEQHHAVAISIREFFAAPTVRGLAGRVRTAARGSDDSIAPLPAADRFPASNAQRRLWALAQIDPDASAAYNMPYALRVEGDIDVTAIAGALSYVIATHEALRTSFSATADGRLWQHVRALDECPLGLADVSAERDPDAAVRRLAARDALTAFDLSQAPLVRATWIRIAAQHHVLLFTVHHIVCDGWSLDLIGADFTAYLEAHRQERTLTAAPKGVQYKEYAAWQQQLIGGEFGTAARQAWQSRLAAPLPVLDLPADRRRPHERSFGGGRVPFTLDAPVVKRLRDIARAEGGGMYAILLAAVHALVHRYTGADEIVVGCPVAARTRPAWEQVVGCFVNMLPLRVPVRGDRSVAAQCAAVQAALADALDLQDYPFDRLVDELGVARDVSRSPVFDVAVVLQNMTSRPLRAEGVDIRPFALDWQTSKFDVTIAFLETGGAIEGYIEFNQRLFDRARIERMTHHLCAIAAQVAGDPSQRIGELHLLDGGETRLLAAFNHTAAAYDDTATIVDLFLRQARATPNAVAVVVADREFSYADIDRHSAAIASALRTAGVRRGDRVATLLDRDQRTVAGLLGVLRAGAAYVPVDVTGPAARAAFILRDCRPAAVLACEAHRALAGDTPVVAIDECHDPSAPECEALPDDPAYVIYTSGSTGNPKGCIVSHRNVVRLMSNDRFPFTIGPGDVWLVAHSFAFDFSTWEIYGALLHGGRCVIAGRDEVRDPEACRALLRRHQVSVLSQTPAAFYALSGAEIRAGVFDLHAHLRYVIFGGDRLDPSLLRAWAEHYPPGQVALINMYGITETTVHVTVKPLTADDLIADAVGSPIGRPLPETEVHVVDRYGHRCPIGIPGELYVGGTGVSLGYLDRPELTAERFVASPWTDGARLYRSGDVGRWRSDGELEYFGRNDDQVQIRGFRVELGEVQAALAGCTGVKESATIAVATATGDQQLRGFVVANADSRVEPDRIREELRDRIPDYMVPSIIRVLDGLPVTTNGKVDREALRALAPEPVATPASTTPANDLERAIAAVWQEVLQRSAVGRADNFFDLGGHSLLIVQARQLLHDRAGIDVPVVDLFRYPTIASLAQALAGRPLASASVSQAQASAARQRQALSKRPARDR